MDHKTNGNHTTEDHHPIDSTMTMDASHLHTDYARFNGLKTRLTIEQIKQTEVTYSNYIETPTLLTLQTSKVKGGLHHHDEHLFIAVHQSFELWFKQVLHELDSIRNIMQEEIAIEKRDVSNPLIFKKSAVQAFVHRLRRCDQILRYTLGTFDILETMHPSDFLEFRDYIGPASGFQSLQHRELELVLGLEDYQRTTYYGHHYTSALIKDPLAKAVLEKRWKEQSIKELVYGWLELVSERVPDEFLEEFKVRKYENLRFQKSIWSTDSDAIDAAVKKEMDAYEPFISGIEKEFSNQQLSEEQEAIEKEKRIKRRKAILYIMCYRHHTEVYDVANLLDELIAMEEAFVMWRTRHVRMVERMIGSRTGTGGSSGVEYLDRTTHYRIFVDLWRARTHFVRPSALKEMSWK